MKGRLKELTINRDGTQNVTVTVSSDFRQPFDELCKDDVEIEIKKHSSHRSLNANAYAWVLIGKIAERLSKGMREVYREAIRDIGGVSEMVCLKTDAVPVMRRIWESNGMGWQAEELESKIPGCTNLMLFYGSSVYDTKQMSLLIDHLIQDAQALGIATITPEEEARLLAGYRGKLDAEPAAK